MKNFCSAIIFVICFLLISFTIFQGCAPKGYINIDSKVGAYYLMFKTISEKHAQIDRFEFLAFDDSNTGLDDDEKDKLASLIEKDCRSSKVKFLRKSKNELRDENMLTSGMFGEEFGDGYILTFTLSEAFSQVESSYYIGSVYLWHSGMDAVGLIDFRIEKNNKGWHIDDSDGMPGYNTMIS